jgi:hypothetical protein
MSSSSGGVGPAPCKISELQQIVLNPELRVRLEEEGGQCTA